MDIENYFSISLSMIALCGTFYTYIVHTRKLNIQQQEINDYQIKKEKEEADEKKKASIEASTYKSAGCWKMKIYNKGKCTATNIRLISEDLTNDNSVIFTTPPDFLPYPSLLPYGAFELSFMLACGHKSIHKIKLIWDDNFSKDRSQEQDINF